MLLPWFASIGWFFLSILRHNFETKRWKLKLLLTVAHFRWSLLVFILCWTFRGYVNPLRVHEYRQWNCNTKVSSVCLCMGLCACACVCVCVLVCLHLWTIFWMHQTWALLTTVVLPCHEQLQHNQMVRRRFFPYIVHFLYRKNYLRIHAEKIGWEIEKIRDKIPLISM